MYCSLTLKPASKINKKMPNIRVVRTYIILIVLCFVSALIFYEKKERKIGDISVVPMPMELVKGTGTFVFNKQTIVSVTDEEQKTIAKDFFKRFRKASGWIPRIEKGNNNASIFLSKDNSLADEEYFLNVTKSRVYIKAATGAGFFYALQTLGQLLPASFYTKQQQPNMEWGIPVVRVKDKPSFKWRGYMLDVSRHFFDKKEIKKVIDFMSEAKLNRFHWHLSDDNGWRIEIKKYPKLTEVGAWRVDYNAKDENTSNWWGRPLQKEGEKATYGGFYTQDDIKEIVAYAKKHYIEVIPEIDMPGHSLAAIASYPEISCAKGPFYVGTGGVVKKNTYCPGKEVTFEFVEGVMDELTDLFPYKYIHIGGDECNKEAWEHDFFCQQRMKDEGLQNVKELQSYFIKRVEKIVNAKGKQIIGWDEILEGGLAPNATVMSWRGEKGGVTAARQGHDVIMTPSKYCYLDLKQGDDDLEPNLGYWNSFLKEAYNYKVVSDSLTIDESKHVLGVQGNLWTESITNWNQLTYMTFPRLYAVAENGWTSQEAKDWDGFSKRLLSQLKKLEAKGERFATSAYNVKINHQGHPEGYIDISLETEVDDLDIYYSLDGKEPTKESRKYKESFLIDSTCTLKTTSFLDGVQVGNISEKYFPIHKGVGAQIVYHSPVMKNSKNNLGLIDLNYGKLNRGDKNWQVFDGDLDVDLIFPEIREVNAVEITSLRYTIAGAYVPKKMEVLGSKDGISFFLLGELDLTKESNVQGRNKVKSNLVFDKIKVKSIKLKAVRVDPIPKTHKKEGEVSKIYIDEVIVY